MKAARRDPCKKLSDEEIRLAKLWFDEDDMEPSEIAALLRRDKSTMTRLLRRDKSTMPCLLGKRVRQTTGSVSASGPLYIAELLPCPS